MTVTTISTETSPSVMSRSNHVMGVVEDHGALDDLIQMLELLGVSAVDVLEGNEGAAALDEHAHSIDGVLNSIFGDLESEMRRRYAQEIHDGRVVFSIPVTNSNVSDVVKTAQTFGAKHVAHFGSLVNESFGSRTPRIADR